MTLERVPAAEVLRLRLILEVEDYDRAVTFYRDALGLTEQAAFESEGEGRVIILNAGRATLELANPSHHRFVDEVEVGHETAAGTRVAFEVLDAEGRTQALMEAGAELVAAPTETPWQSLNSRLDAPAGIQITLFQELTTLAERENAAGFGTDARRHGGSDAATRRTD